MAKGDPGTYGELPGRGITGVEAERLAAARNRGRSIGGAARRLGRSPLRRSFAEPVAAAAVAELSED